MTATVAELDMQSYWRLLCTSTRTIRIQYESAQLLKQLRIALCRDITQALAMTWQNYINVTTSIGWILLRILSYTTVKHAA